MAERRDVQCFQRRIRGEGVAFDARHRRQQPLQLMLSPMRDRLQIEPGRADQQLDISAARRDGAHFANGLNYASKHFESLVNSLVHFASRLTTRQTFRAGR